MRLKFNPQLKLFTSVSRNQIAKELQLMSQVLDATPSMLEMVYRDIVHSVSARTGRKGMTADQVLRCAILKQYRQLTYEELAFHLEDSSSFRGFARLDPGQYPGKSILQENIKGLREETWEAINKAIIGYAQREKIESGRKIRIDATAVETDIHHPTDATLLADGIRIITRWLIRGKELTPTPRYLYSDHRRVVKKRLMVILNTNKEKVRREIYRDILLYADKVRAYALVAIPELSSHQSTEMAELFAGRVLAEKLARAVDILGRVMDQTERRVFKKKHVPASEKVVSFFETHTDIIVKKRRETEFGHKVFFTGGVSSMILDCLIVRGNPADTTQYQSLLMRQLDLYDRMPRQVSLPSLQENDPMAISEAIAASIPVLTSNRCGLPYIIADGEPEYLVDPLDSIQIGARLKELFLTPELCRRMVAKGREIAMARFHPDVVAAKTWKVCENELQKRIHVNS